MQSNVRIWVNNIYVHEHIHSYNSTSVAEKRRPKMGRTGEEEFSWNLALSFSRRQPQLSPGKSKINGKKSENSEEILLTNKNRIGPIQTEKVTFNGQMKRIWETRLDQYQVASRLGSEIGQTSENDNNRNAAGDADNNAEEKRHFLWEVERPNWV